MSSLVETPETLRPLLRLSMPVLVEQLLRLLIELVDMWLTGNYLPGESYVAAMALVVYLMWLLTMAFSFVATGTTALVARFTGAGDPLLANRVMNQSISAGFVWSLVILVAGLYGMGPLVEAMGLEGDAARHAERYMLMQLYVLPAMMVEIVGIAALRGAGDTRAGLLVMAIVNVVNTAVSYGLVTGAGGMPNYGWEGIAIGTAVGRVVGAVLLLAMLAGGRAGFRLTPTLLRPDRKLLRRLLRVSIPAGMDSALLVVCNLAYLRIVLRLGDVAAAAHGVTIQVEALAYMPGGAFQIAAATMAGQFLGAGLPNRATRSALVACAAAATLMGAIGLLFYAHADWLVAQFLGESREAIPLAAQLLRLISTAMVPLAVTMVFAGAMRGAGDTRWPLVITVIGFCVVRIPIAMYLAQETVTIPLLGVTLPGAGWGAYGAWCGAVSDLYVRAILMSARFWQGGWKRVRV
ncbi:MAG: MATE family efflux transporter [Lacipirellulaceae bacterium]